MDEPARPEPSPSLGDGAPEPSPSEAVSGRSADSPARPPDSSGTSTAVLGAQGRSGAGLAEDPAAALPPAPFVAVDPDTGHRRIAPLTARVAILTGAVVIIGLLLWMGRDAVRPFIVGLLLVYLLEPPVRFLANRRVPRPLAILLVYAVFIIAIVEFLNLTLSPLINEARRLIADLPALMSAFDEQIQRLTEIYAGLSLPPGIRDWIDGMIEGISSGQTGGSVDPGILLPVVSGAGGLVGALFGYLILPVWAFYLLKDRVALTRTFDRALPAAWRPDVWATMRIVARVFGQWVRGQLLLGVTVAVATFLGLMLLSQFVDPVFGRYAVLLSIIAGVLELLPIIGPIIAAIPAVLLAATAGLEATIAALVLYTAIQQLENYILVPKIQGDAVQLHPAAVIFALIVGGALAGLLGAILALPVVAAFRDVVRYLFRRVGPPSEAGSIDDLRRDLGIEPAVASSSRAAAEPSS